jgi:hypothetical protein
MDSDLSTVTENQIVCTTCRLKYNTLPVYKDHITSEFHNYNMRRKVAKLDPVTEQIFNDKKQCKSSLLCSELTLTIELLAMNPTESVASDMAIKCDPCGYVPMKLTLI